LAIIRTKLLVAKLFGARLGLDTQPGGHVVDPQFITIGMWPSSARIQ
jgi:hypothetical protein